jgi:hypothetical protein
MREWQKTYLEFEFLTKDERELLYQIRKNQQIQRENHLIVSAE